MANRDEATIPFWAHQAAEYLVGLLLVLVAAHLAASGGLLLAAAGLVIAIAALTDGPLGCGRVIGRRAHRALDFVIVALLAAGPLLLSRHDLQLWIVAESAAIGLGGLARSTRYTSPSRRARGADPSATSAPSAPVTPVVARRVGGTLGRLGRHGPRALGRVVGRHRAERDGG